jgi:hypothetical protein
VSAVLNTPATLPLTIDIGYCGTDEVLPPRSRRDLSDFTYPLHANFGLCSCWTYSAISRTTERNDMAINSRLHGNVYCVTQRPEQTGRWMDDISLPIFCDCSMWLFRVLLPSWTTNTCSELL